MLKYLLVLCLHLHLQCNCNAFVILYRSILQTLCSFIVKITLSCILHLNVVH